MIKGVTCRSRRFILIDGIVRTVVRRMSLARQSEILDFLRLGSTHEVSKMLRVRTGRLFVVVFGLT